MDIRAVGGVGVAHRVAVVAVGLELHHQWALHKEEETPKIGIGQEGWISGDNRKIESFVSASKPSSTGAT